MGLTIPRRPRSRALAAFNEAVETHDLRPFLTGSRLLRWEAPHMTDADVQFAHHILAFLTERHANAPAIAEKHHAMAAERGDALTIANHARALTRAGRYVEADGAFARAIAVGGGADVLAAYADVRDLMGDTIGASALDWRASNAELPQAFDADQRHNTSFAALTCGRFARGWRWYAGRKGSLHEGVVYQSRPLPDGAAHWGGQETNRPVVVLWEQGLGDTIMLLRWLRVLRHRCKGGLYVEVQPPLFEWARAVAPWATVAAVTMRDDGYRAWPEGWPSDPLVCWTFDLPPFAGMASYSDIPSPVAPSVGAPPADLPPRAVAVQLFGSLVHRNDSNRSIPEHAWAEVIEAVRDAGFAPVNLQPDARAVAWAETNGVPSFTAKCFRETGAVLRGLAGVLTVDTALAHAAGSLGVPTVILLPRAADWRWGRAGDTSRWYPAAALVRAPAVGVWPIEEAVGRLASVAR